ncbi:MAG: FAD-binding oxidoreductase [Roseovarius sp.]
MKVRRLPVDPGPAGWDRLLPPAAPPEVLEARITADWLVIGAGYAGLAAVQRLAELHPGARIVLLEASRVGAGPAGRNSGFMIDLPHDLASAGYSGALERDRAETTANRAGIDFAAHMAERHALPEEAFVRSGKTNAAATAKGHKHNLDYARHLDALGEPYEMLDAAAMQAMTGISYYRSGLFTPGAAMIQPALYVRGVAAGLRSNRVQVFEGSPVTGLSHAGDWIATTPMGAVTAPRVILAVNGHAESFGQFENRLLHVFTYASMTRALRPDEIARLGGRAQWALTPADPMGTTVRRISGTGGDRIIIRNRFTCDPTMEVPEGRLGAVAQDHARAFAARFTMLAGVEMEHVWGGRLCLSINNVPALGEVAPGLFSAACQNGLGTAKGTLHGMLMAELASGHGSDLLAQVMAQDAPRVLPPRWITKVGANARMRWGEWSAGAEL